MKRSLFPKLCFALVFLTIVSIFFLRCTKGSNDSVKVSVRQITSANEMNLVRAGIQSELKKGILIANLEMKPEQAGFREQSSCVATAVFKGSSFVTYENGDCATIGTYASTMTFQIGFGSGATLLNPTSLSPVITLTYLDGTQTTITPVLSVGPPTGAAGLRTCSVQKFTTPNYCSLSTLKLTITPSVACPDGQTYSTESISLTTNIVNQRTDACLSIAPFFVQTLGQPHQITVAGFSNPCFNNSFTPCIAFPDKGTFYYRVQGTSGWPNSLNVAIYNGGAYTISNLTSGVTYEYYTVGTKTTGTACNQQPSEIKSITVL